MHPYIKHLIEDIQNAEKRESDYHNSPEPKTFEEEMEDIERYISGEGELPLSQLTGINDADFPPAHKLSVDDMESVLTAYDKMLFTWNTAVDWPEEMPIVACYNFLLKFILDHEIGPVNFGMIHLDFCTGYAPDCAWDQFCKCKEFWDEDE